MLIHFADAERAPLPLYFLFSFNIIRFAYLHDASARLRATRRCQAMAASSIYYAAFDSPRHFPAYFMLAFTQLKPRIINTMLMRAWRAERKLRPLHAAAGYDIMSRCSTSAYTAISRIHYIDHIFETGFEADVAFQIGERGHANRTTISTLNRQHFSCAKLICALDNFDGYR